ncbi:hypothetical protein [Streptomyces sp. NPDC087270]|uniref:hypothetical protein n=1 Tax=Streptomyces sp. NPDC087270 TaxID=3365774 RepID=UPI00382E5F19
MPHRTRRTASTTTLLAAATASLALAAGCSSSSGSPSPSDSTATRAAAEQPLLPASEADKVVDTYQSVNNQANAQHSPTLMAKVEAGAMLASDNGYFTQLPKLDKKEVAANLAPFVYVQRSFFIPPASAKANWFVMKARIAELKAGKAGTPATTYIRFLVFQHLSGGWRAVAAAGFSGAEQKAVPALALDGNGLATVVDPAAKIGTHAPKDLAGMVADLYATGGEKSDLAKTKERDAAISVYTDRGNSMDGHAYADYKAARPPAGATFALRTKDGGALVLSDSAVDETVLAKDLTSAVNLGPSLQPFVKNGSVPMDQVVEHDMQSQLGVISPSGRTSVYTIDQQTTAVDATPSSAA